jgi:FlaG/FlaF family flagellin (archaellin)
LRGNFKRDVRGISTVIATIIIVSIAIVMAIAAAYWAMGIGNAFTKFEKIEFTNIYSDTPAAYNFTTGGTSYTNVQAYRLVLTLKNTGSATATIDTINLNGRPYSSYNTAGTPTPIYQNLNGVTITPGQIVGNTGNYYILLPTATTNWRSGEYVQIDIGTTAGRDYQNTVTLP